MKNSSDPLARALLALSRLEGTSLHPVVASAWEEATEALQEAQDERKALLAVKQGAWDLVDALDDHALASEAGNPCEIAHFAQACAAAEEDLRKALDWFVEDGGRKPQREPTEPGSIPSSGQLS